MADFARLQENISAGQLVPILGPGALRGALDQDTQEPIPADNRSLILALNNGREMMPRLMYEFSRAAQHIEQRRGQAAVGRFLDQLYRRPWTRAPLHALLAALAPPWVVDLNRDNQLLETHADRPHLLVKGAARIMEKAPRYQVFKREAGDYRELGVDEPVPQGLPVLFKPLGCSYPEPGYIASDADFVDYLTELMGGFALPPFLKAYRKERQYLLLGVPLSRDTERMLVTEITHFAGSPRGWVFLPEPTAKEERYCRRMELEIINQPTEDFVRFLREKPRQASAALSAS